MQAKIESSSPVEHMLSCTKPYEPTAVLRQAREMTTPLG